MKAENGHVIICPRLPKNNNSHFQSNRLCVFFLYFVTFWSDPAVYLSIMEDDRPSLFGLLHLLATLVPVCSFILWEYYKFNKSLHEEKDPHLPRVAT